MIYIQMFFKIKLTSSITIRKQWQWRRWRYGHNHDVTVYGDNAAIWENRAKWQNLRHSQLPLFYNQNSQKNYVAYTSIYEDTLKLTMVPCKLSKPTIKWPTQQGNNQLINWVIKVFGLIYVKSNIVFQS